MPASFRRCAITVMDNIADPDISFDQDGVCNYFHLYKKREKNFVLHGAEGEAALMRIFDRIKSEGKGRQYDCITGVSGGVDSTYMSWLCMKHQLRPLIVHLDNGWNSEIANQNINNILDKSGYDLYTHVIDWEEFRDLQLSFLKASVVDLELTSDHAIFSVISKLAHQFRIKYVLNGFNISTEGILPPAWRWYKYDWLNIESIHRKFGNIPLKTFPHQSFWKGLYYSRVLQMETIQPLNFLDYRKDEAKSLIIRELGWRDYGGKHYESIITRFYQGYILPVKFGIDKRKAHLSSMICSGQITREQALEELEKPGYEQNQMLEDKEFVLKKFGLTESSFDAIMNSRVLPHTAYPSYITKHYVYHEKIMKSISPLTKTAKSLLGKRQENKSYY
jgi:N-acetyl sugar amidotransferase